MVYKKYTPTNVSIFYGKKKSRNVNWVGAVTGKLVLPYLKMFAEGKFPVAVRSQDSSYYRTIY